MPRRKSSKEVGSTPPINEVEMSLAERVFAREGNSGRRGPEGREKRSRESVGSC